MSTEAKKEKGHILKSIITGVTVNVPVLGTFALIQGAVKYVDEALLGIQTSAAIETVSGVAGGLPEFLNPGHYVPFLYKFPGTGLIVLALYLYFTGVVFNTWLGQKFHALIDTVLGKFPLISTAYNFLKSLMEQMKEQKDEAEKKPVFIHYTREGILFPAFDMGECKQKFTELEDGTVQRYRMIYMLTAPNPTSGMVVAVREDYVEDAQTDSEAHMKMILSCGMTQESVLDKLKRMAKNDTATGEIVSSDDVTVDRTVPAK